MFLHPHTLTVISGYAFEPLKLWVICSCWCIFEALLWKEHFFPRSCKFCLFISFEPVGCAVRKSMKHVARFIKPLVTVRLRVNGFCCSRLLFQKQGLLAFFTRCTMWGFAVLFLHLHSLVIIPNTTQSWKKKKK